MEPSSKPSDWVLFVYMKPADFLGYLLIQLKQTVFFSLLKANKDLTYHTVLFGGRNSTKPFSTSISPL